MTIAVTESFQSVEGPPRHCGWFDYHQAVKNRLPRETLRFALDRFKLESDCDTPQRAIDLGCGDGRDTVEILRRGWQALAIDGSPDAIERLIRHPGIDPKNLMTQIQQLESSVLPINVDLLNAGFCLPFCPQETFSKFWTRLVSCLRAGGRFSGQLLGDRDSWAQYPNMNFHTRHEVEELLSGFVLEFFKEEECPGKIALGEEKNWHIFQIVARKQ